MKYEELKHIKNIESGNKEPEKLYIDIKDVKVGCWYSKCCYLDLCKIETEDGLKEILKDDKELQEEGFCPVDYFETKLNALYFYKGAFSEKESLDEIEVLITKELKNKIWN